MRQVIDKLKNMIVRGTIGSINDEYARQNVTARMHAGEIKDRIERPQMFGLTTNPPAGCAAILAAIAGDRSRMVCLSENYYERPKGLNTGETQLYDAFKQFIYLKDSGVIEISANGQIILKAAEKIRFETPILECTGEIKDRCDSDGQTMSGMRSVFNGHTHTENGAGSQTHTPSQQMGGES